MNRRICLERHKKEVFQDCDDGDHRVVFPSLKHSKPKSQEFLTLKNLIIKLENLTQKIKKVTLFFKLEVDLGVNLESSEL